MMIIGGHSGIGLVAAREISASGLHPFITTVSKRGRPEGLGPESALMQAMMQGDTPHYMAKCDTSDPVAFNCLWEWGPAGEPRPPVALLPIDDIAATVRSEMSKWSNQLLQDTSALLQEILKEIQSLMKQFKYKMANPKFKDEICELKQTRQYLEELEADVTEVLADVLAANAGRKSGVLDAAAEKQELQNLRNKWRMSLKRLAGGQ
mmetsp:Transcript_101437/g.286151  ORF Transcript_101437/g.286151 Transcript_101437/m.286151 type:complete len:207 (-) Transcript_101437:105-725(-)